MGGTVTRYAYDGAQVLTEMSGTNIVQRRYVYGPGIDTPLMVLEGSEKKYLHLDGKGSVLAASNAANAVTNKFTADAWGNGADEATSPYRFTARRVDAETGNYYYRNRYYSARQGRFMSQDPIGYGDGLNMYAYVKNDPVNYSDPMGLNGVTEEVTVTGTGPSCNEACRKARLEHAKSYFDALNNHYAQGNGYYLVGADGSTPLGDKGLATSNSVGPEGLILDPGTSDFVSLMLSIDAPYASDDPSIFEEIVTTAAQSSGGYMINLLQHQGGSHYGHAMNHVGKSRSQILNIMRTPKRMGAFSLFKRLHGTFFNLRSANSLVSATLSQNHVAVQAYLQSGSTANMVFSSRFGSLTGFEGYALGPGKVQWFGFVAKPPKIQFRDTMGAEVVIRAAPGTALGFVIVTAYTIQ